MENNIKNNTKDIAEKKEEKIKILLVDDDKGILFTLRKLVEKIFPQLEIFTAYDGKSALEIVQQETITIIISDYNMPIMNGAELLQNVRANEYHNSIYFIMVTANSDASVKRDALNLGADEFLSKPIITESLETRLKSAIRIIKMQMQLKQENVTLQASADDLEEIMQGMIKLSMKFMHARIPSASQVLPRIAAAATWIAEKIGRFSRKEIKELELAAYLSQSGRFSLPDNLVKSPVLTKDGNPTSPIMTALPAASKEIVGDISRFENIAKILFSIYENIDGSGFPAHIRTWQIPLAARIIRVCLDFEELCLYGGYSQLEAMEIMRAASSQAYDNRVIILFENFLKNNDTKFTANERIVTLAELSPRMITTRDLVTNNGNKLISAGVLLTQSMINKIISHSSMDPILGDIYVKK